MSLPERARDGAPDAEAAPLAALEANGLGDRIKQGDAAALIEFLAATGVEVVPAGPAEVVRGVTAAETG